MLLHVVAMARYIIALSIVVVAGLVIQSPRAIDTACCELPYIFIVAPHKNIVGQKLRSAAYVLAT